MGWKASTIIINKPTQVDNEIFLKELGFNNLSKIEDEPFEVAMNPDANKVYIGLYKDNLIVCAPDIPMHFFENGQSDTEKILTCIFPDSEICSIVLHSVVNLWGYSISQNGERIRVRAGSADDGTFIEIGDPLEEEKELLSKSRVEENGSRIYLMDDAPDEPCSEDQVGENFVFLISKRYFGDELHRVDDLLFETNLAGYSYNNSELQPTGKTPTKPSKWILYLIAFLLILIWQILKKNAAQ